MAVINDPATLWKPANGKGEYTDVGVNNIIDPLGNFLVDPQGNFVVDTGQLFTQIPATLWTDSEGAA